MIDVDRAMSYLDFVEERHAIWYKRQAGAPQPWTDDPILASRKFTNVFRVLDPGSQYLVRDLLEPWLNERDTLARCFLYRYTNLPSTWEFMRSYLGDYPRAHHMGPELVRAVQQWRDEGNQIFSGAYMILPQPNRKGDKVEQAITLAGQLFAPSSSYFDEFMAAGSQAERFAVLSKPYGVGPFLAMQILTDWGYTSHSDGDRENEFVMAGPGAKRGAALIDPSSATLVTLGWAQRTIHQLPDCPLLGTRKPSLMDVQNTLCEFSKYARYASKAPKHPKKYRPAHPGPQPEPRLPEHWSTA